MSKESLSTEKSENDQKYRGYFFGNMYLSSLQQGLQAAHVIQKMSVQYMMYSNIASKIFYEWSKNDKTIILLNGGSQRDLQDLARKLNLLTRNGTVYPVKCFEEEESALNNATTSVGIVIPERIYSYDSIGSIFDGNPPPLEKKDMEIHHIIKSCALAH